MSTICFILHNVIINYKRVQWNFFKKGKEITSNTNSCSLSISICQRAAGIWESPNISHNSPCSVKFSFIMITFYCNHCLLGKWGFSSCQSKCKRVSVSIACPLFPSNTQFLHVLWNQKYWKSRKEGGESSTEMHMNQRGGMEEKGGRKKGREVGRKEGIRVLANTVSKKQFDKTHKYFFLILHSLLTEETTSLLYLQINLYNMFFLLFSF